MPTEEQLQRARERARGRLEVIRSELAGIHLKRIQRRRHDVGTEREETRERIGELLELQDQATDDLERLEILLEILTDDNPDNDPDRWVERLERELGEELQPRRIVSYLVAEIDLLEREVDRRDGRLRQHRQEAGRQRERWESLDRKAKRRAARRRKLERRKRRTLARIHELKRELAKGSWPEEVRFVELLYHAPPHLHAFTYERGKLIEIAKIAEAAGIRCGEFPPFDDVECVHVAGSGHYRTAEGVLLPCDSPRLNFGGDAGCAADFNDEDGGSDKEVALYHELVERY